MGKTSQRKGREGEISLSRILQSYGYKVRTGIPVSYGVEPDLIGLPGIHIECKRVEKLDLYKAMDQAVRDSERFHDGLPAVFHRKNRKGWLVTMRLDDWIRMYRQLERRKDGGQGPD